MGSLGAVGFGSNVMATPIDTSRNAEYTNDFLAKTGLNVDSAVITKTDGEILKNTYDVISQQMALYPEYTSQMRNVQDLANNLAYAATNGMDMKTNIGYHGNINTLETMYNYDVSKGFHPKGTTWRDIVTHEMGHVIVRGLINKVYKTSAEQANAWKNGTLSKQIRREAEKDVQKNWKAYGYDKKPTAAQLRREISRYATNNADETIAEAWADYHANGNSSMPLSRAIYSAMRKRM